MSIAEFNSTQPHVPGGDLPRSGPDPGPIKPAPPPSIAALYKTSYAMCVCLLHNQLMFVFVAGSQPASGLLSYKSYAVRVINSGIWYSATLNVAGRVRCQAERKDAEVGGTWRRTLRVVTRGDMW